MKPKYALFLFSFLLSQPSFAELPKCVNWARNNLENTLLEKEIKIPKLKIEINDSNNIEAEEFIISKTSDTIRIDAKSSRGAMYGLFALEDLAITENKLDPDQLKHKPFLKLRADNPFIHHPPFSLNQTDMWRAYIDMVTRSKFNFIDFHGSYNLDDTQFPNLYPLLVTLNDFPNVGDADQQKLNLESLRVILNHAKDRCIDIGIMNYTASVDGLDDDQIESYTEKAVSHLLKELPELKWIGFRVGESGRESDFFKNSYLKGIKNSGRDDIKLYTRSWQTTKDELAKIGKAYKDRFAIEIKFNGEHLGLPYQAIQEGGDSYSYQSYLTKTRPYDVIWQIRANGTHRFFAWAQFDFIRRTILTSQFGDAIGFTLEPHTAYFPTDSQSYFRSQSDQESMPYIWQKHWAWYRLWGYLSFDPEFKKSDWNKILTHAYGPTGPILEQLYDRSGWIIPLLYSYRYQGPDHRNHSPETETGHFWVRNFKDHHNFYPGYRFPLPFSFIDNKPMDQRSFVGIKEYVDRLIKNNLDGRINPLTIANQLRHDSNAVLEIIAASDSKLKETHEWSIFKPDFEATAHLGLYFANRIEGLTKLYLALETDNKDLSLKANQLLENSLTNWINLSEIADHHFKPQKNMLRIHAPLPSKAESNYQWSSQIPALKRLNRHFKAAHKNYFSNHFKSDPPILRIQTDSSEWVDSLAESNNTIDLNTNYAVTEAKLFFKPLSSSSKWKSISMDKVSDSQWTVTLPELKEGWLYQVEVTTKDGIKANYPYALKERPYRVIKPKI